VIEGWCSASTYITPQKINIIVELGRECGLQYFAQPFMGLHIGKSGPANHSVRTHPCTVCHIHD